MIKFLNRHDAGRALAADLKQYAYKKDVLALALPRGGVPVAYEIAHALHIPLDVLVVRKLGAPCQRELAIGALAPDGIRFLNSGMVEDLAITQTEIAEIEKEEGEELKRRESLYRAHLPPLRVAHQTVILIDDGLATGSTMKAAVMWAQEHDAKKIIVAAPIASRETCRQLTHHNKLTACICTVTPEPFFSVGMWYEYFSQTSDEEVLDLLRKHQTDLSVERDTRSLGTLVASTTNK